MSAWPQSKKGARSWNREDKVYGEEMIYLSQLLEWNNSVTQIKKGDYFKIHLFSKQE